MKKFSIGLLALGTWCAYGSLDQLATALQKLELMVKLEPVKPGPNKSEDFLGPWMVQNRPQDLIASADDFANSGIPVYQIKVLKQLGKDCWVHALRNGLYFMDLLASPRNQFDAIYNNMVSSEQYDAFTKDGCPKRGAVIHEFTKKLICRPKCVPENTEVYLKNICNFRPDPKFSQNELSENKKILATREGVEPSSEAVRDYTIITHKKNPTAQLAYNMQQNPNSNTNNLLSFIDLINQLQKKSTCTVGFAIGSDYATHQTTLVLHKIDDTFECLFSDSNNSSFEGDNTVSAQIRQFIHFVKNKDAFHDFTVRVLYEQMRDYFYLQKKYNVEPPYGTKKKWQQKTDDFAVKLLEPFYSNLKKYNLLDNTLYQSQYKKLYCNLITQEQQEQPKSMHYSVLLKKIGCL